MVKRYKLKPIETHRTHSDGSNVKMVNTCVEDPNGEWVKYEDVKEMVECDCEEMYKRQVYEEPGY